MLSPWLDRIATALQRQPEGRDRLVSWHQGIRLAAVVTLLVASALTIGMLVVGERTRLGEATGRVPLGEGHWRIYVEEPGEARTVCGKEGSFDCLADPAAAFWREARPASLHPKLKAGERLWLSLVVPPEMLRHAAELKATHLAVGYLYGHHDVFVDGRPIAAVPRLPQQNPLVVDLTPDRLASGRPLSVIVRLTHDFGSFYPYSLASEFLPLGFVDDATLRSATTLGTWAGPIFHWSMGAVYLFLGIVFGILWLLDERFRESSMICAYTLFFALVHLLDVQRVALSLPYATWNYVSLVLTFYEGVLGAFLGFAFARSRSELFVYGLPLGFLVPLAALPLVPSSDAAFVLTRWLSGVLVPAGYLAGALACLLQARLLRRQAETRPELLPRVRSLMSYGASVALLALLYCVNSGVSDRLADYHGFRLYRIFHHVAMVVAISYLYYLTIQDYAIRARIADRTHLSRFHRLRTPGAMDVVVVGVDLKRSERILALEDWVRGCMNRIRTDIVRAGGAVVSVEGDGLLALVEAGDLAGEGGAALLALTQRIHAAVDELSAVLVADGLVPPDAEPLRYRLALAPGRVRAVFDLVDGREHPGWAGDDQASPFLTTARLLGADKVIDPGRAHSNVLVSETLVPQLERALAAAGRAWAEESASVEVKHGNVYRFAVLRLAEELPIPLKARA